jgi:hypothetical protein
VVAGAVDQDGGVGTGDDRLAHFGEHDVHGLGRGPRQDNSNAEIAIGADGAEQIGRLEPVIPDRPGTAAAGRPAPGQRAFLTDAGLILEPDLNRRRIGLRAPDFLDYPGEVFLNASWAAGSALGWIGRGLR